MSAYNLFKKYSIEELTAKQAAICADPANHTPRNAEGRPLHGIDLYTKSARKRLDDISWAITWHLKEKREKAAEPPPCPVCLSTVPHTAHADPLAALWADDVDEPDQAPLFDDTATLPLFSGTPYLGKHERFDPQPAPPKQLGLL